MNFLDQFQTPQQAYEWAKEHAQQPDMLYDLTDHLFLGHLRMVRVTWKVEVKIDDYSFWQWRTSFLSIGDHV